MAVSVVGNNEGREGRSGVRWNGKQIETFHTFHYLIDAGSKTETRENVLYSGVLPFAGITTRVDGSVCSNVEAVRDAVNPRYWHATVEYSTQSQDQDAGSGGVSANPLTWIPRWKIDNEVVDWIEPMDSDGTPVANSANVPFDEGMPFPRNVSAFRFTQYEPDNLTEKEVGQRNGVINSKDFKGFPKYSLLLNVTGSERGKYSNGYSARKIEYLLKFRVGLKAGKYRVYDSGSWVVSNVPSGWLHTRFDIGSAQLVGSDHKSVTTSDGYRMQARLDGSGSVLAASANPVILAFKPPMLDFNSFLRI